jgi:hypothetical protein
VFTSIPLAACWRYEPREHRKPLAMLRDLRFRLPHCGTGSATPITIDFGAIFPFTLFRPTTSLSTLRSGRYRPPNARLGSRLLARLYRGRHLRTVPTAYHHRRRAQRRSRTALVWGFLCQGYLTSFFVLLLHSFCSTRAASILPSRPHITIAVARSDGQGRRFFSAAEGLSLTDASTAAGCS